MDRQPERNIGGQENLGKEDGKLGENIKVRAGCGMEDEWGQQRIENNTRESWEKSKSR